MSKTNKNKLKSYELPLKKREKLFQEAIEKLVTKYKITLDVGHKIVMVDAAQKPNK